MIVGLFVTANVVLSQSVLPEVSVLEVKEIKPIRDLHSGNLNRVVLLKIINTTDRPVELLGNSIDGHFIPSPGSWGVHPKTKLATLFDDEQAVIGKGDDWVFRTKKHINQGESIVVKEYFYGGTKCDGSLISRYWIRTVPESDTEEIVSPAYPVCSKAIK